MMSSSTCHGSNRTTTGALSLPSALLASAIRQTYERLEILVIGDHCDGHRRSRPVGPGSKNSICKPSGSR